MARSQATIQVVVLNIGLLHVSYSQSSAFVGAIIYIYTRHSGERRPQCFIHEAKEIT